MDRDVFLGLADEVRPYLQPGQAREDLMCFQWKSNSLWLCSFWKTKIRFPRSQMLLESHVVQFQALIACKVCDVIARVLGPKYMKWPSTESETKDIMKGMGNKNEFPQAFGCIDGTRIAIKKPTENPHDYSSYKQKYALNTSSVWLERVVYWCWGEIAWKCTWWEGFCYFGD